MPYLDTQTDTSPILDQIEPVMPPEYGQNRAKQEAIIDQLAQSGLSEEKRGSLKSELINAHVENIRSLESLAPEALQKLGRAALLPEEQLVKPSFETSKRVSFKRIGNEHSFKRISPRTV